MGYVRNGAPVHDFNELMARATAIAAKQDAHLMERARERRREIEAKMRAEEKAEREKAAAEARQRAIEEKKRQQALEQKRQQKRHNAQSVAYSATLKPKPGTSRPHTMKSTKTATAVSSLTEKKKPVQLSFDELMQKAKEQSIINPNKTGIKSPVSPTGRKSMSPPQNKDKNTPSIYHRRKPVTHASTSNSTGNSNNSNQPSARERARQILLEPPKKIVARKKDRLTISEVQRSIRHAKGKFSDDEDDIDDTKSRDKRLMPRRPSSDNAAASHPPSTSKAYTNGSRTAASTTYPLPSSRKPAVSSLTASERRKRPLSPATSHPRYAVSARETSNVNRHPPLPNSRKIRTSTASSSQSRPTTSSAPIRRMPFTGKPLDPVARRASVKRRHRDYEDEEDEELSSFIVSDDDVDEDPVYTGGRSKISDEISKIFRYDRSKYANEPVFSDDDMEAAASDVLREEKRSERLARREDLIEEQKELERLKRRKKNNNL